MMLNRSLAKSASYVMVEEQVDGGGLQALTCH